MAAVGRPSGGAAVGRPSGGAAVGRPSGGAAVGRPSGGAAVGRPSGGAAVERPSAVVLRALGLGDFLVAVPAMRGLRAALGEGVRIVLAAPSSLAPLVRLAGAADGMVAVNGLEPFALRGPPDNAVNLHGRGPQSHAVLRQLRPRRLVGFGNMAAGHDGPGWRPDEHEAERWCRLIEETYGIPVDSRDLRLPKPVPRARPGQVIVHPGAAFGSRRWPADQFGQVAAWAVDEGHDVVVTGGGRERSLAERVCEVAGLGPRANLAGSTDLHTLAAQIAHARLVICGDTGVAHLATAFGTPSVVLFGPVPPAEWGPRDVGPHVAVWKGHERGDPWAEQLDPALAAIEVADVVDAARTLLEPVAASGRAVVVVGEPLSRQL
jgi:ADP-heptose:LPS heptosyltransferase